jgi:adenosylcobinamide-GDP ribazoletransferase
VLKNLAQLVFALRFLTILPVPNTDRLLAILTEKDMAKSYVFFPVIGLLKGGFYCIVYYLTIKLMSLQLSALMVLIVSILVTGGFHLDGLADTFDALSSRKTKEEKLKIMKESTIGAIGTVAIILVLLSKYISLVEILKHNLVYVIIVLPVIGECSTVVAMSIGRSARKDGLGKLFVDNAGIKAFLWTTVSLLLVLYVTTSLFEVNLKGLLYPLAIVYLFILYASSLCNRHFGGLTGDNLGFIAELSELVFLFGVIPFI